MPARKCSLALLSFAVAALAASTATAQQSARFRVVEYIVNAAGHPHDGSFPSSTSYRIRPGHVGEGIAGVTASGPSYRVDAGFGAAFAAPGEIGGLRFADKQTLEWLAEPSVGTYNLYRDLLSNLVGGSHGACEQYGLTEATTTSTDDPPPEEGWLYLVTAVNRIDEEGTKGSDSGGSERGNDAPCP